MSKFQFKRHERNVSSSSQPSGRTVHGTDRGENEEEYQQEYEEREQHAMHYIWTSASFFDVLRRQNGDLLLPLLASNHSDHRPLDAPWDLSTTLGSTARCHPNR